MKPGRELDALVAEKVMGLKRIGWESPGWSPVNGFDEEELRYGGPKTGGVVPAYSTNITAAWLVVRQLRRRGLAIRVDVHEDRDEVGCMVANPGVERAWNRAAKTAPHAICLAALAAVGTEVPA